MALVIVGLYVVGWLHSDSLANTKLLIPIYVAILATVTACASLMAYIWAPQKYIHFVALALFYGLIATSGLLLEKTGLTSSPFIVLWMFLGVFAGLFGSYGLIPLILLVNGYLLADFVLFHNLNTPSDFIVFGLAYELPLLASYLLWHPKSAREATGDRAYSALAKELSQVANKSEIVINAIADGVIAVDSSGIIQLINPAAQTIIGWGKQDALKLDYRSVLKLIDKSGQAVTEANDPVQHVLSTNENVVTNELTIVTNSGNKMLASVLVSPVGHSSAGAIIVFRDITKQKQEEQQQAEFISTASHEMRTPVAAIEGYLGLALNPNTATVDEKARTYLNKAHESAQHLGRLFQDLLDVTKVEDGRLSNNPKVIDVVAFAEDVTTGLNETAKAKGLVLLFKPKIGAGGLTKHLNPVFYVNADADHLREVLANLVENAVKYTKQGDVTVDVTGDNTQVIISVKDTGIGIPPEDASHLFQKFYRVDNSDTREIGGTGLGLYLCRRLVETMGGRIWVKSELGKGSTFFVSLARLSHEEATTRIEQSANVINPNRPTINPDHQAPPATNPQKT